MKFSFASLTVIVVALTLVGIAAAGPGIGHGVPVKAWVCIGNHCIPGGDCDAPPIGSRDGWVGYAECNVNNLLLP